ncbi:MAG: hypothetical protein K0R02_12 [Rickettsiaceae bacterium]|jgi:ankyrin repeat protein|nr:hypothetical protein [Rickettsiaceae bacterium]
MKIPPFLFGALFMIKRAFDFLGYPQTEPSFEETYKKIKINKNITRQNKKDINYLKKSTGETLLSHAVKNSDKAMVKLLLEHGEDVNELNHQGESLLHLNLKTIIEKDFSTEYRLHDCSPLTDRGIKGLCHIKTYKLTLGLNNYQLLQNKLTNTGKDLSTYLEINKLLLDHGSNINHQDKKGNTIAHYFVEFGLGALIEELLNGRELDYNIKNSVHKTPLLIAIDRNDSIAAAKLIEVTNIADLPEEYNEDFEIMLDSLKFGATKNDPDIRIAINLFVGAMEKIISNNLDLLSIKPLIEYYISSIKPCLKNSMTEIYIDASKRKVGEEKITKADFNPINIINKLNKAYYKYQITKDSMDIESDIYDTINFSGEMVLD